MNIKQVLFGDLNFNKIGLDKNFDEANTRAVMIETKKNATKSKIK